ncbi:MAG: flagellin [SAR324 cluster bacterium]|nr:flagellin [SAR324 cluster bacterium]
MSLRINNNVDSMIAYRHLESNSTKLSKSLEKLSSGERINSAADGPAAIVVSEYLRAELGGLEQAIRNNESAVSMVQTAEGSLGEVARLLIDVRQRAIAAANEGANDDAMVAASQAEIENALAGIDRVASNTQFARRNLLDGSGSVSGVTNSANLEFVKGSGGIVASDEKGYDVFIKKSAAKATLAGRGITDSMIQAGEELTIIENGRTAFLKLDKTMTTEGAVRQLGAIAERNGLDVTISGSGGSFSVIHNKYGKDHTFSVVSTASGALSDSAGMPQVVANGRDVEGTINGESAHGKGQLLVGNMNNSTTPGLTVRYSGSEKEVSAGSVIVDGGLRFQVGGNPDQSVAVSISDAHTSQLGRGVENESEFLSLADVDVTTLEGAQDAINVVDRAIEEISMSRGDLGAFQRNTLDSNLSSLRVAQENLTSAESVIRDTDMAHELARFTRNQIMVQSATAQLAHANAVPQNVVRLLSSQ